MTEEHSSIEQATSDPSHVEAQGNDTPRLDIANMVIQDIKGCIGGGDTKAEVVEEGTVNNVEEIAKYQDVRKELNQVTAKVEDKEVEEKGTSSQSTPPVDVSARSFNFLGQEESDDKESFVTSSSMLTEADTDKVSCITALTTLSEIATKSTTQLASSLSPAATFRARMEAAALQGLQLNLNLNFKKKLEADKANKKLQVKTSQMDLLLNPSAKEWGSGQWLEAGAKDRVLQLFGRCCQGTLQQYVRGQELTPQKHQFETRLPGWAVHWVWLGYLAKISIEAGLQ